MTRRAVERMFEDFVLLRGRIHRVDLMPRVHAMKAGLHCHWMYSFLHQHHRAQRIDHSVTDQGRFADTSSFFSSPCSALTSILGAESSGVLLDPHRRSFGRLRSYVVEGLAYRRPSLLCLHHCKCCVPGSRNMGGFSTKRISLRCEALCHCAEGQDSVTQDGTQCTSSHSSYISTITFLT